MAGTEAAAGAPAAAVDVPAADLEGLASAGPRSARPASAGSVVDQGCVAETSARRLWPCCPSSR